MRDHFYKRGVYCDISRASPHIWVFFLVKIYPRQERFILLGHFYKEEYIGTLSASPHIRVLQRSDLTKRSVAGLPLQVSFYRRGRILLNSLLHSPHNRGSKLLNSLLTRRSFEELGLMQAVFNWRLLFGSRFLHR